MRSRHPPSGTRFFARVLAAVLECPQCGDVVQFSRTRRAPGWDPRTSRYTCRECAMVICLGLLAWPVKAGGSSLGTTIPQDHVPDERQLAQLRAQADGTWLPDAEAKGRRRPDDTNVTAACTCVAGDILQDPNPGWDDPNCPLHGGRG